MFWALRGIFGVIATSSFDPHSKGKLRLRGQVLRWGCGTFGAVFWVRGARGVICLSFCVSVCSQPFWLNFDQGAPPV